MAPSQHPVKRRLSVWGRSGLTPGGTGTQARELIPARCSGVALGWPTRYDTLRGRFFAGFPFHTMSWGLHPGDKNRSRNESLPSAAGAQPEPGNPQDSTTTGHECGAWRAHYCVSFLPPTCVAQPQPSPSLSLPPIPWAIVQRAQCTFGVRVTVQAPFPWGGGVPPGILDAEPSPFTDRRCTYSRPGRFHRLLQMHQVSAINDASGLRWVVHGYSAVLAPVRGEHQCDKSTPPDCIGGIPVNHMLGMLLVAPHRRWLPVIAAVFGGHYRAI